MLSYSRRIPARRIVSRNYSAKPPRISELIASVKESTEIAELNYEVVEPAEVTQALPPANPYKLSLPKTNFRGARKTSSYDESELNPLITY